MTLEPGEKSLGNSEGIRPFFILIVEYSMIFCIITMAIKHIKCHAGLDPASSPILDSRFRGNDGFDTYCCRSNIQ